MVRALALGICLLLTSEARADEFLTDFNTRRIVGPRVVHCQREDHVVADSG